MYQGDAMLSLGEKLKRVGANLTPASSRSSLEKSERGSSYQQELYSNPGPGATEIVEVLRKRLAVLSGGEDKRGGPVVTIFAPQDDFNSNDLKQTLHFLKDLIGEEEREIGLSVLLEGSPVLNRCLEDVIGAVQNVFGDCLYAIYVYSPHGLWNKSRSSPDVRKSLQENTGATLSFVTQQKLFKVISPFQLSNEFGGTLEYNHPAWLERQLAIEKFLRDARIIRKHAESTIHTCEARLDMEGPNPASVNDIQKSCNAMGDVIHNTFVNGQKLLLSLQSETTGSLSQCGKGALKQNASQLRSVRTVLDSVASIKTSYDERWKALHGALRQISNMQRFVQESAEVVSWVESEGERLLKEGSPVIAASFEEALVKRKHMHQVAALSMECYSRYLQLKSLAQHLLREPNPDVVVIQSTMQRLDATCQVFATKVDARRRASELAVVFYQTFEHTLKLAKDVERRVCAGNSSSASGGDLSGSTGTDSACDSCNSDGCSVADDEDPLLADGQTVQDAHKAILELDETSNILRKNLEDFKRISMAFAKSLQNREFEAAQPMVQRMCAAIQKDMDGVKTLIDTKRNHLVQTVQLLSCEQDAKQSIHWLEDLCLAAQNSLESDSGIEEQSSRLKHEKMDTTAKEAYEYGRRLLDTAVKLRKSCKYKTGPSMRIADHLFNGWLRYINITKGGRNSSQSSSMSSPSSSPITPKVPLGKSLSTFKNRRSGFFLPPTAEARKLRSFHSCSSLV